MLKKPAQELKSIQSTQFIRVISATLVSERNLSVFHLEDIPIRDRHTIHIRSRVFDNRFPVPFIANAILDRLAHQWSIVP